MAIYKGEGKDLWMYEGDTGNFTISGLPKDKAYQVYFSLFNEDNDRIVAEKQATSFNQSTGVATFIFDETFSNTLKVGDFTYALKGCASGGEDTWIPETIEQGGVYVSQSAPTFTVKPKRVKGTNE